MIFIPVQEGIVIANVKGLYITLSMIQGKALAQMPRTLISINASVALFTDMSLSVGMRIPKEMLILLFPRGTIFV